MICDHTMSSCCEKLVKSESICIQKYPQEFSCGDGYTGYKARKHLADDDCARRNVSGYLYRNESVQPVR